MLNSVVEIKKTPATREIVPDVWWSFGGEVDRLGGGFRLPSMCRMFDLEPLLPAETSFGFTVPAVDVSEDDKAYKISAELPGLDETNIEISLSSDSLVLTGEKPQENEEKNKNHYVSERCYGSFQRAFRLPRGIDRDKIDATFVKGVLTVTLPKTVEVQKQQKKIEIKAA